MRIEIANYRRSDSVEGGVDADVLVYMEGEGPDAFVGGRVEGEITVLPREDRPDVWGPWGSADHWASADLVKLGADALERIGGSVDDDACRAARGELA